MTKQTGGCLCGALRYTAVEAEPGPMTPEGLGACHCEMCRRQTGGVMLSICVAPDGLTFEDDSTLGVYASSDWAERGFCTRCGSSMFWRLTADGPAKGLTMVTAGTLDDPSALLLTHEVYIDTKPGGDAFVGPTHQMTEAEVLAAVNA